MALSRAQIQYVNRKVSATRLFCCCCCWCFVGGMVKAGIWACCAGIFLRWYGMVLWLLVLLLLRLLHRCHWYISEHTKCSPHSVKEIPESKSRKLLAGNWEMGIYISHLQLCSTRWNARRTAPTKIYLKKRNRHIWLLLSTAKADE